MSFEDQKPNQSLLDDRDVIFVGSLGQQRRRNRARWGPFLVIYMRIVAALWLVLGLIYWLRIMGPGQVPLDALPMKPAGAIVFFAVVNLLAAAGLWMATPWGGVLWLVTLAAEMSAVIFMPAYFPGGTAVLAIYAGLAISYFLLTYYAANERID